MKQLTHCMYGSLTASTNLQSTTSCTDVQINKMKYGLCNNSSWNLTNINRPETGLFVKKNKMACHKSRQTIGMDKFSTYMMSNSSQSRADVTEADLIVQHRRCHAIASKPEGPAAPLVLREAEWTASAFKPSNRIGCTVPGGEANRVEGSGGLPRG